MKTMQISIAASTLMSCALLAAVGECSAQDAKARATEIVRKVPLRDAQGQTQAQLVIVGNRVRFEAPNGAPLSLTLTGNSSRPPIQALHLPSSEKADEFSQKSISTLQRQIDALSSKVLELTERVNELSK